MAPRKVLTAAHRIVEVENFERYVLEAPVAVAGDCYRLMIHKLLPLPAVQETGNRVIYRSHVVTVRMYIKFV
jgi:hypothetical protein